MKKNFLICSILLLMIMFLGGTGYWGHASSSRSQEDAYKAHKAELMCSTLKEYDDYVYEAVINTETNPIQVNIISGVLPPEEKDFIEKFIFAVFPDAVIDFAELSPEEILSLPIMEETSPDADPPGAEIDFLELSPTKLSPEVRIPITSKETSADTVPKR